MIDVSKKKKGRAGQVAVRVLYLRLVVMWLDVAVALRLGFYRGPAVIALVVMGMEAQWQMDLRRL